MWNRNKKDYAAFLEGLQPGASITYVAHRRWAGGSIARLENMRRTATQFVFTNEHGHEERFRASDGKKIGASYEYLPMPATAEELKVARIKDARVNLAHHTWGAESDDVILAVLEIITKKGK